MNETNVKEKEQQAKLKPKQTVKVVNTKTSATWLNAANKGNK